MFLRKIANLMMMFLSHPDIQAVVSDSQLWAEVYVSV